MFKKALLSSLVSAFLALSIFTVATAFGETTPSGTPPSGLASPTFGGLRVNGTSAFYGSVQIGDHLSPYSLMVTNGIDLYGDLNMRGGGSDVYTNSLYVSENIMNNVLGDPFPVYIYDDLTTAGKIITNNGLDVNTTILNAKAGLAVTGNTTVSGTTTSTGRITANGGLDVNNSALNAKAGLAVTGTTTSSGKITANGGLDVNNSALNAKAGLAVTGTTTSSGKLTVTSGGASITGRLTSSDLTVSGTANLGTTYFNGPIQPVVGDALGVNSWLTVAGTVTATGVNVNGNITGTSVGRFYKNTNWSTAVSFSAGSSTGATASIACDAGDIVVDCSFYATPANSTSISKLGPGNDSVASGTLDSRTCYATGVNPTTSGTIAVRATCFSPNG